MLRLRAVGHPAAPGRRAPLGRRAPPAAPPVLVWPSAHPPPGPMWPPR